MTLNCSVCTHLECGDTMNDQIRVVSLTDSVDYTTQYELTDVDMRFYWALNDMGPDKIHVLASCNKIELNKSANQPIATPRHIFLMRLSNSHYSLLITMQLCDIVG